MFLEIVSELLYCKHKCQVSLLYVRVIILCAHSLFYLVSTTPLPTKSISALLLLFPLLRPLNGLLRLLLLTLLLASQPSDLGPDPQVVFLATMQPLSPYEHSAFPQTEEERIEAS